MLLTYTFGVFQTVEMRKGQRVPPEFAFFTFSVLVIVLKLGLAVVVPKASSSIAVVHQRHQHVVRELLGYSQSQAELMRGLTGKLDAKLTIDEPDSGQRRDPVEFGMLTPIGKQRFSPEGGALAALVMAADSVREKF